MKKQLKKLSLCTVLITVYFMATIHSYGQTDPEWQWIKSVRSGQAIVGESLSSPGNHIVKAHLDEQGNVYIFGKIGVGAQLEGEDFFDHAEIDPRDFGPWKQGIILAKIDQQGNFIWKKIMKSRSNNGGVKAEWVEYKEDKIYIYFHFQNDVESSTLHENAAIDFFGDIKINPEVLQIPIQDRLPPFKYGNYSALVTFDYNGNELDRRFIQMQQRDSLHGYRKDASWLWSDVFHVDNSGNTYLFPQYIEIIDTATLPYTLHLYHDEEYNTYDFYINQSGTPNDSITNTFLQIKNEEMMLKLNADWEVEWIKPLFDTVVGTENGAMTANNFITSLNFDEDDNMYITWDMMFHEQFNHTFPVTYYFDENNKITLIDKSMSRHGVIMKYNSEGNIEWCNQRYSKIIDSSYVTQSNSHFDETIIINDYVFLYAIGASIPTVGLYYDSIFTIPAYDSLNAYGQGGGICFIKYDKQTGQYITHGNYDFANYYPGGDYIDNSIAILNNQLIANGTYDINKKNIIITKFDMDCNYLGGLDTINFTNVNSKETGGVCSNSSGTLFTSFLSAGNTITMGEHTKDMSTSYNNHAVMAYRSYPVGTPTYTVSGTATENGIGLNNANITYNTAWNVTTNPSGFYSFDILKGATVTITPSLQGYNFSPQSETILVNGNKTVNFTANKIEVGLNNLQANDKIIVYPNPANEKLFFSKETLFEIYDVQGKLILQSEAAVYSVNIKTLNAGIYSVKIIDNKGDVVKTERIVINR